MARSSTSVLTSERKTPPWSAVVLGCWILLRLLTSLWAAMVSAFRPLLLLEEQVALWPPSAPLGVWLYRVFISPLHRWDVDWYRKILVEGYHSGDGTSSFHPLYPWSAGIFYQSGLNPVVSLLLVSSLAGLGLLLLWKRLARLDLNDEDSRQSFYLFLFSPLSFVLFIPYTEALFLFLSCLSIFWIRQHKWLLAGFAGGLAVLTRQQGLVLGVVLLWEMWETSGRRLRAFLPHWRGWASAALMVSTFVGWLLYRGLALNDVSFHWRQPDSFLNAFLISSTHSQVVPVFQFLWPWNALALALEKAWTSPDMDILTNLVFGLGFLALLVAVWKNLNPGYRLYSLALVLIAFSYHTGAAHPYMGLLRHLWLAFPVFIGLAPLVHKPWQRLLLFGVGLMGMMFLLMLFVLEGWVS